LLLNHLFSLGAISHFISSLLIIGIGLTAIILFIIRLEVVIPDRNTPPLG
jgi:hypothetical protein